MIHGISYKTQKKKISTQRVIFFVFYADFRPNSRRIRLHHESEPMRGALQGLLALGEGAAHHDGALLSSYVPQEQPPQLLLGEATGPDLHQLGLGVLYQRLLQRGAHFVLSGFMSWLCFSSFPFSFLVVDCVYSPDDANRIVEMQAE